MNETFKFLKEKTQVNYVATINGNVPSLRPFGDPFLYDGKIYVITNKKKNVSKQIAINNHDSDNIDAKKKAIAEYDWAEAAGYTLDNPNFQILYMHNVAAVIYDEEGHPINSYNF